MANEDRARLNLLAPALVIGLTLAWGSNWPAIKIALLEFPVWTFRAWTAVVGGLCLLGLARLAGGPFLPRPSEWPRLAVAAFFTVTAWQMFIAFGLRRVASGDGAVLGFTMPLWAVFLSRVVFGEKIGRRGAAALGLGVAGILVLLARDVAALGRAPLGAGLIIAGAIGWAIGTLIQKRHRSSLPTLAMTGWQVVLGSLPMLVMVPIADGVGFPHASPRAWLAASYTIFAGLVFGYYAWFKVVRLLPVHVASISTLLTPVVGVVSGAILLGETIGLREIAALTLIGTALALVLLAPPRAPAS